MEIKWAKWDGTPVIDWMDVMRFIKLQDVREIGEAYEGTSVIVTYKNTWYSLCDNGGEINVSVVNGDMQSVPYMKFGSPVDACTLGYRIMCAMKGEDIDYLADLSEYMEVLW